jgi:hypothetical protein
MTPKVELTSLSISKLRNDQNSFVKYDIEAALDEVENTETDVKLKYKFVLLSNPTNTKISVEGIATIFSNQSELPKYLGLDEKKIPHIVNIIYQEIFPLFYVVSKSMQIPCPAYKLSEVSAIDKESTKPVIEQAKDSSPEIAKESSPEIAKESSPEIAKESSSEPPQEQTNASELQTSTEIQEEMEKLAEQEPPLQEPVIKS